MTSLQTVLKDYSKEPIKILDNSIPLNEYCPLDLSESNSALKHIDITNHTVCQKYIDDVLRANNAQVAYGGYLEKRNLYADKSSFSNESLKRNIHLGIDFWAKAYTKVVVPIHGKVHSYQNNVTIGDYGPTIILEHILKDIVFYTLYGHLSLASIANLQIGQEFKAGDTLATLGTPDSNVNYAPHLHFQIIIDLEDKSGDYQGVAAENQLDYYTKNCPNPNFLLKM